MRYIFFGTPRFAAIILEELIAVGMPPAAVVCNPDRPVGRKKAVTPPPTKRIAENYGHIAILQPEELDEDFVNRLRELGADFFVVAAYAKIIPKRILDIPRLGALGVHPSLLPRYRGASPIQSAILNGERETGVSIYQMDEKMDHGPVIALRSYLLREQENYAVLEEKLAKLSATLLRETIPAFIAGRTTPAAQDEGRATYTRKFKTGDAFVDESDLRDAKGGDEAKARAILRKINAFASEPGAWTLQGGKRVKLLEAAIADGILRLVRIQEEGKRL